MKETQHSTYDDKCEGLTYKEINALYGLKKIENRNAVSRKVMKMKKVKQT
jgi:hypothetical protein